MAAGFSDGVIRLLTHSYIDSDSTSARIDIEHVIKPHSKGVTAIAFSPDGSFMATGSHDQTIFLFKIKYEIITHNGHPVLNFSRKTVGFIPIGFLNMGSSIDAISFSPDNHRNVNELEKNERFSRQYSDYSKLDTGRKMLMLLNNGGIYSANIFFDAKYDNSVTFELNTADFNVQRWNPKIDVALQPGTEASLVLGTAETNSGADESQENQPAEKVLAVKIEDLPEDIRESVIRRKNGLSFSADSNFTNVMYLEGGYFLGSLVNSFGEGELRVFKLESPELSRLLLVHHAPFSQICMSRSLRYLLAGTNDGVLCVKEISVGNMILNKWKNGHETYENYSNQINLEIQNARLANNLEYGISESGNSIIRTPSQFWMGYAHESVDGKITGFQSSFDDSYFVSSGRDGSLFVWRCPELSPRKNLGIFQYCLITVVEDDLFEKADKLEQVQDISDPAAYSIQEVKIKSERDREVEEAEKKKMVFYILTDFHYRVFEILFKI